MIQSIHIKQAQKALACGEVVVVPTETVYGLAANAYLPVALKKIFAIKARPYFDPLIIHIKDIDQVPLLTRCFPAAAQKLAKAFWPGGLTLLLPKKGCIPDLATSSLPTVALRVSAHPIMQALTKGLSFPLAAPSANPFGYISPTKPEHVKKQLGDRAPYIIEGGACALGIESTIVGFPKGVPTIYRQGAIAQEAIESVVGRVEHVGFSDKKECKMIVPGLLPSHYAPHTPLLVGDLRQLIPLYKQKKIGVIAFDKPLRDISSAHQVVLSPKGDLEEAAQNLFAAMHQLDSLSLTFILVERLPNKGVGKGMNERLQRASYNHVGQQRKY